MALVACIVGFAIFTTIQRLDRTGKAARWRPAVNAKIITVQGRFLAPLNPSDRKPIKFAALDGEVLSLECYASRGVYSSSRLNTCLPMLVGRSVASDEKKYTVKYYVNHYRRSDDEEKVILSVAEGGAFLFEQSIAESSAPR
jgi:hypothetical protein